MQKKAKNFFIILMVVFLVGVLIHLTIPLQIVVNATQKIQEAYNGYKIQVEQNTVRSIAYLNSLAISNHVQMYENIRSYVIRLFEAGNRYLITYPDKVLLNSAYQLANKNATQMQGVNLQKSMWFLSGVQFLKDMNQLQMMMYNLYTQIQSYLDTIKFEKGLEAIQIIINYEGEQMYFQFPSTVDPKYKSLKTQVLNSEYHNTILNLQTQQRYQTIFDQLDYLKACSPILDGDLPFAVVCLKLQIKAVTKKISSSLKVPNFQHSSSRYYLVRPLYKYQKLQNPQIISYFSSEDLTTIYAPTDEYLTDKLQDSSWLFSSQENYLLNFQQLQRTKSYYITPIQTYNNNDKKQIILYLVVINDFSKSSLRNANHYQEIFVVMIIPTSILLIIAALAMGFIMKPLFGKLHYYSNLMNQFCHYIKKNDMSLQIQKIGETSDFIQIFKNLHYLNLLNKFCTLSYFKTSDNEKVVKLMRALQLFDILSYSKVNIYMNLAECYFRLKQYQNAMQYLKLSINSTLLQLGGIDNIVSIIKQEGDSKTEKKRPQGGKRQRPSIRHLRYKVFRLCELLYHLHNPKDKFIQQELTKNLLILKQLHYKSNISAQYIYCFILESIISLDNIKELNYEVLQYKLDLMNEMIRKIQNSQKSTKIVPCQIIKQYRYYYKGKLLKMKHRYHQAYQSFLLGLDGTCFDPHIHQKIKQQIKQIVNLLQIEDHQEIQHIFNYLNVEQKDKMSPRQFIFLSDVSNPRMSTKQFNQWKSMARKMTDYIFDNFIRPKDRIGISEFCTELKVVCNLIQKGTSQNMLKKQLMSSIKARDQTIYSQLIINLQKAIQRTKTLKRQRIFIIFLKQGYQQDSAQIMQQIKNASNSKFIFLVSKQSNRISNKEEGLYIVEFDAFQDIEVIMSHKSIKRAENIIYLL